MNNISKLLNTEFAYTRGIYGKGIGVAILDTGIYPHVDFTSDGNRILAFTDFVNGKRYPYDDSGHGTHVAGIIGGNGFASNGLYKGIAPKCNLICIKILNKHGNGSITSVQRGINWVIRNKEQYNIRIINISIGSDNNNHTTNNNLIKSVEKAWDSGLVVLTAAGNLGPKPYTITAPGTSKKIITIGISEEYMPSVINGIQYDSYSGCGPTYECVIKPEIVAPGSNITSCSNISNDYTIKSGTSMSTPVVSGVIALLLEKAPNLSNKEIKKSLYETAINLNQKKNKQGWGLINLPALLTKY